MNNYSTDSLEMLIRFFNMQAGTACRTGNEWNQKAMISALDKVNGDFNAVRTHIKEWVAKTPDCKTIPNSLTVCLDDLKATAPAPAPVTPTAPTEAQVSNSLGILEQALVKVVAETSATKIENEIMGQVKQTIADFIKSEYGTLERKIVTIINGEKKEVQGVLHEKFDTVLKFVANNEPVFLTGPAGSGKNYICKQVAEALGLDFYFTNAVTQEYKLTGFTDANGRFQETQFYKAFTQGGVFMLDEMDASIPEVLVILNAAIANRYFDFPAPIGYVEAHPNFRVIAAGNTLGHGADFTYVGRNQLDGASLDRFAVVSIDYSKTIEDSMAQGNTELADFCREYRKVALDAGLQVIVSYRAISRLAKMIQLLDTKEALDTCLTKGLGKDDLNIIAGKLSHSKYSDALRELARVA